MNSAGTVAQRKKAVVQETARDAVSPVQLAAKKAVVAKMEKIPSDTGLDRAESRKLRVGEVRIEARIDLHGMTQAKAHLALTEFMDRAIISGNRTLLVITGRGTAGPEEGRGVLRRMVPDWLRSSEWAAAIRHITPAAAKHGGAGAFYVVLRKFKRD